MKTSVPRLLFVSVLILNMLVTNAQGGWTLIKEIELPHYQGWSDAQVVDNYLYLTGGGNDGFINIYDITNMTNPSELYSQTYTGDEFGHMMYEDNKLYIVGATGLYVFDITNRQSPSLLLELEEIGGYSIGDYNNIIRKSGNLLFVNSGLFRFMCIDITTLNSPVYKDSFEMNFSTIDDFYVLNATTGILNDEAALRYVDFSNPEDLQVTLSTDAEYIDFDCESEGMALSNDKSLAFIGAWCSSSNRIHTVNLTTNQVVSTFDYADIDVEGVIGDISINDDESIMIAGNVAAFHIFDMTDPSGISFVETISEGGHNPVEFFGNYILANGSGDLKIYQQDMTMEPVADFTSDVTTITEGGSVNFTDLSANAPTTWIWSFGDGGSSTAQNPSYEYAAAGTYTVQLIVSNTAGTDTITKENYITVSASGITPEAIFSASPLEIETGGTVVFSDLSLNDPTSWSWDFGDGATSTERSPEHVYADTGSYTVSLVVENAYGSDTETKVDYISVTGASSDLPDANFEAATTFLLVGDTVRFTDLTTNNPLSWYWEFGDGGTSNEQNPTYTYQNEGVYTVKLIATNINGSNTEIKENYISVSDDGLPPVSNFEVSDTAITVGQSVAFTDMSKNNPTQWFWNFGDGSSSTEQNPYHIYFNEGTFSVELIVSNEFGVDTLLKTDVIVVSAASYCEAGSEGEFEFLTGVEVGDISNLETLRSENGYMSYIEQFTEMDNDQSYEITIHYENLRPEGVIGCWIDWNHDFDFEDEGEFIALSDPEDNMVTGTIEPPIDAMEGSTRMRVRVTNTDYNELEPCGIHDFGETEDYSVYVNVVSTIGINEMEMQALHVFPNPSDGEINITLPYELDEALLEIYTIAGKKIYMDRIHNQQAVSLNLEGLTKGIYLVQLTTKQQIYRQKLMLD